MNRKNLIFLIKIAIILVLSNFLLTTLIRFGIGVNLGIEFLNSPIINVFKDLFLLFLIFFILTYHLNKKTLLYVLKKNKFLLIILTFIIIFALLSNYLNGKGIKFFVIGFKYDIWPLLVIFFISLIDLSNKEIKEFFYFFLTLIKYILVISLGLAILRFIYPNLLYYLGFGSLGDWQVGSKPPVFYKTGVDGVQRIQGIFSGPNNFSFFLVAFWPLVFLSIFSKKLHFLWGILFIILLFGTLSRSGVLAFTIESLILLIFLLKHYPKFKKYIYGVIITFLGLILTISIYLYKTKLYEKVILKHSSTSNHAKKFYTSLLAIKEKPLIGHGIGTAGPSAHYTKTNIIPESWILQIFYEFGLIGGNAWFMIIIYLLLKLKERLNLEKLNEINILKFGLLIGVIGLIIQGLVLHSFEDTMVVLTLSILIGITLNKKEAITAP